MTISLDVESARKPSTSELRFVAVRANLLPTEVLAARANDRTRKHVLAALAALVALLALAFAGSWWQTHAARNDLAAEQRQATSLRTQTNVFAPLVAAQDVTSTVHSQLQRLLAGDIPWQKMLATLQTQAPDGVALTQVTGTVSTVPAGAPANSTPSGLPTSGHTVGSMTISGTARDKNAIADFVDALSRTPGLTAPFLNSVSATDRTVTFNVTVSITSAALGGRWTPSSAPQNGGR